MEEMITREQMEKLKKLQDYLRSLESVAVAFSSGVDSTFLLKVAKDTLGDKVMAVTVSVIGLVLFLEYKFHLGIYDRLMKNSSIMRVLTGGILFLVICTYGKDQPHRSFMHSLVAGFMLTCCVNIVYPDAGPYFAVAFLSHLALDLLNYKRVKIFWPLKKGYSRRFCSADGWVNRLLLWLGPIALAAELVFSAPAVRLVDRILSIF